MRKTLCQCEKISSDVCDTVAVANALYSSIKNDPCLQINLKGGIGAGKTLFARSLMSCFGVENAPSPSFQTALSYETPSTEIYHFDLFRLPDQTELPEDLWEMMESKSLRLIEWAERCSNMPPPDLLISFDFLENNARRLSFNAESNKTLECLKII